MLRNRIKTAQLVDNLIQLDTTCTKSETRLRDLQYVLHRVLTNDFGLIDFAYQLKGKHIFMKPNLNSEIVSGLGRY